MLSKIKKKSFQLQVPSTGKVLTLKQRFAGDSEKATDKVVEISLALESSR